MLLGWDQGEGSFAIDHQGVGEQGDLGIATLSILHGLANIRTANDPGLELGPQLLFLQSLPSSGAIGSVFGICDGNVLVAGVGEGSQVGRGLAIGDPATGVPRIFARMPQIPRSGVLTLEL